jgi:hypothetical protein
MGFRLMFVEKEGRQKINNGKNSTNSTEDH